MKQEILVKLKSAEEETAKRLVATKERAADLLKQARAQAEDVRRHAQEDARRDQEAQLASERARLAKDKDRILAEGAARDQKLRDHYKKQADSGVEQALEVFTRSLDA